MDIANLLSASPRKGMNITNLLCAPPDQHRSTRNTELEAELALHHENHNGQLRCVVPRPPDNSMTRSTKKSKHSNQEGASSMTAKTTFSVIPDRDRKRPYRVSTKHRERRLDNQVLESRKYNLMLDINNLKQEVRYLQERRDLYLTRLTLSRQYAQGEAVGMVTRLFRLFCAETCGVDELEPDDRSLFLSRVHSCLTDPSAGGRDGIPYFMQTWKSFKLLFTHRSYVVKSIRSLTYVGASDDDEDEDMETSSDAKLLVAEARRRCGPGGGCVVESTGEYSGRLKRDTIAALLPHVLQNEVLVLRLIGQRFTCPLRQLAYFNSDGQLVDHTAEFDVFGALHALIEAIQQ